MSHELRTPLTSIIGSLRTLQRPQLAPPDPNAQQLLSTAHRQANRLRSLIEDLLVVSRIDNQALPVRPQLVELESFLAIRCRECPTLMASCPRRRTRSVEHLRCDPDHLGRIITNLLYNAIKYAPDSPLEIWARQRRGEMWLSVIDHGPGIPYELHDHIFDRFTQVAGTRPGSKGGTGLGLSIVRGLTESMGGRCGSSRPSAAARPSLWASRHAQRRAADHIELRCHSSPRSRPRFRRRLRQRGNHHRRG